LNEEATVIRRKHGAPPAKVCLKAGGEIGSACGRGGAEGGEHAPYKKAGRGAALSSVEKFAQEDLKVMASGGGLE
jgi:hypothetical protein